MKGMADNLRALSETVTNHHHVLNLLHGLNKRFDHMKIFIKQSQSFPSFHTVRNNLELEEIELDNSTA
jgi:predicted nucleic acid-binding OB-fold protein